MHKEGLNSDHEDIVGAQMERSYKNRIELLTLVSPLRVARQSVPGDGVWYVARVHPAFEE